MDFLISNNVLANNYDDEISISTIVTRLSLNIIHTCQMYNHWGGSKSDKGIQTVRKRDS